MDKAEALERLHVLLREIDRFKYATACLQNAEKALSKAKYNYPSKLEAFDKENKPGFLIEAIGKEPICPKGIIKLAVPVYLVKKAKYEKDKNAYLKMLPLAEAAYREKFAERRRELTEQDIIEQQSAVAANEAALEQARQNFTASKVAFEKDDLLSERMKSEDIVKKLIGFFEDGRSDTLKEAINLWYDEKRKDEEEAKAEAHRQEMAALEEERVRAAHAAEDYARMQYEAAQDAADCARQAAYDAKEVAERIEQNQYFSPDNNY